MLVAERQQKIVELVNQKTSVRVTELSKIFSVTEETIRRDLEKLEKGEKLRRSHGGAVSMGQGSPEIPYSEREIMNVEEKREIAAKAVKYVEAGDRIVLDASSTAWYMAQMLPDMNLTVLTNSIKVAMELSNKENITVISTGGMLLSRSLSYVGPLAERSLDDYHVNKAFVSCKGLHLQRGISESNELQARVKKKMIEISDSVYVMVDYSKFNVQALTHVSSIQEVDHVIIDSRLESSQILQLEEAGMAVTQVEKPEVVGK